MGEDKSGDMSERGDRREERHCDDQGVDTGGRVVADQSVIYPVDSVPPFHLTILFGLQASTRHIELLS